MTDVFNLVFSRIEDGQDPEEVKQKLARSLKTEEKRVQAWFDASAPITLLKEVDEATAQKVKDVVSRCGARALIERVELEENVGGLSLVPKKYRTSDDFICPACGFHEEIPLGTSVDTCKSCGVVVSKWREKQKAEKEKEKIRKKLLRDAALDEKSAEDERRKREELARLEKLEAELRKELGIKGPSPLWLFFEKHPVSISVLLLNAIVALTATGTYLYTNYLDELTRQSLVDAEPSLEMIQMAPVMASAVQIRQTGNQQIIAEMATMSGMMRGRQAEDTREIQKAATTMMKGAGSGAFMDLVMDQPGAGDLPDPTATMSGEQQQLIPINMDTMGGIAGLAGVARFPDDDLPSVPHLATGTERVLELFAQPDVIMATKAMPDAPPRSAVEQLDGSEVVSLMKSLASDREWSQFLRQQARLQAEAGKFDDAEETAMLISDPESRASALSTLQVAMVNAGRTLDAKVFSIRINQQLDLIHDPESRAHIEAQLGFERSRAGDLLEPAASLDRLKVMIEESDSPTHRALMMAVLATTRYQQGDWSAARTLFVQASNVAAAMESDVQRLIVFTRIAKHYYNVRNTTLANQILTEAARLASSTLEVDESARVFAEIALAQAHMGDLPGAFMSIDNTGSLNAQMQVKTRMAEAMISEGQYYQVLEVVRRIPDQSVSNRLLFRSVGEQVIAGKQVEARRLLAELKNRLRLISDPYARSLFLGKLGRLHARLNEQRVAQDYFDQALTLTGNGRKADVVRATIAMDQAQALLLEDSLKTLSGLENPTVGEPVESAVRVIHSVSEHFIEV